MAGIHLLMLSSSQSNREKRYSTFHCVEDQYFKKALKEKWKWSRLVVSDSLQPLGLYPTRLLHPWNFPGKSIGGGCQFLLQGIFPAQGLNLGLTHCRQMLYHLSQFYFEKCSLRIPWKSSGLDSVFPWQRAWVQFLVGELRSRMPCGVLKKKQTLLVKRSVWKNSRGIIETSTWMIISSESASLSCHSSLYYISSIAPPSSVQSLSHVRLFATPWTTACQTSLFITYSHSLLKFMPIESVMPSNCLILCRPLLLPPSIFPSIRVFSNKSVLHISGQSIGASASASVLPMNIQDWFPLGLTGWISLQSKGLSRVFNTTVPKHQFFGT